MVVLEGWLWAMEMCWRVVNLSLGQVVSHTVPATHRGFAYAVELGEVWMLFENN